MDIYVRQYGVFLAEWVEPLFVFVFENIDQTMHASYYIIVHLHLG